MNNSSSRTLSTGGQQRLLLPEDQFTPDTLEHPADSCTDDLLALETILMCCPLCQHQFKLIDGLLADDLETQPQVQQQQEQQEPRQQEQLPQQRLSAPQQQQYECHQQQQQQCQYNQQQHQQQQQQQKQSCNSSRRSPLTPESDPDSEASTTGRFSVPTTARPAWGDAAAVIDTSGTAASGRSSEFGFNQEPAPSQICQTFQIVNRTIDQLERLICDPYDRRIRKISSMSQCDIEIRSELPSRKFGAAKNYCLLRAISPCRIDKCRSLLRQQMGWVMLPKP